MKRRLGTVFYGWWIVAAALCMQTIQGGLYMRSYASYVVLLRGEFAWSKTMLAIAFSLSRTEIGLLGPIEGWMIDRFGPRPVLRVGVVIFGLGFIAFSMMQTLPQFFLASALMAIGSSLGGHLPLSVSVVNWFERRRSMALGIMSLGFAIGGLLTPLVVLSLEVFGWRATAFGSGILVIAVGLPLAQIVRHRPEAYGMVVDGRPPASSTGPDGQPSATVRVSFTAREAMRTRAFWFISFGHASALLVVSAVMVHLAEHLTTNLGYSLRTAGGVMALLTVMQLVGQVIGGFIGDLVSKRLVCALCMAGHAGGLAVLAFATAPWMVVAFAVLHGLAWGGRGPLMSAIRAEYFGPASFGTIVGFSSMVVTLGMTAGPILAGVLADRTGNYEAGFTILATLSALGSLFFIFATRPQPPLRPTEEPERGSTVGVPLPGSASV